MFLGQVGCLRGIFDQIIEFPRGHGGRTIVGIQSLPVGIVHQLVTIVIEGGQPVTLECDGPGALLQISFDYRKQG